MRIKGWKLELVWEDNETNDVSCYVPAHISVEIERFCDYWQDRYGDEPTKDDDEEFKL